VSGRLIGLLALTLVAHASGSSAWAEPGVAAHAAPAIQLTVIGGATALRWARSLVGTRNLDGATLKWNAGDVFDPRALLAPSEEPAVNTIRAWLDLSDSRRARIYFAARERDRFLLREVELSGNFDAVDHESLASVLELSLAALLEDDRAGLSRAETQALLLSQAAPPAAPRIAKTDAPPAIAPTRPATPPARTPAKRSGELALFYAAVVRGSGPAFAQGPGVIGSLGYRFETWRAAAWLAGQYLASSRVERQDVDLGVQLAGASTRAGFELARRKAPPSRHAARVRLGAGVDFLRLAPFSGPAAATAAPAAPRWSSTFVLTAAIGDGWWFSPRAYVAIDLLVDVAPVAVDYQANVDGRLTTVLSTWRARPGLALELGF
jgi:hypothetical protein